MFLVIKIRMTMMMMNVSLEMLLSAKQNKYNIQAAVVTLS